MIGTITSCRKTLFKQHISDQRKVNLSLLDHNWHASIELRLKPVNLQAAQTRTLTRTTLTLNFFFVSTHIGELQLSPLVPAGIISPCASLELNFSEQIWHSPDIYLFWKLRTLCAFFPPFYSVSSFCEKPGLLQKQFRIKVHCFQHEAGLGRHNKTDKELGGLEGRERT